MRGYTKLHAKIVHSSIWREPNHVRIVWITMLAIADANGVVEAAVSGLAHLAGVTIPECEDALTRLIGPDPYSSDGTSGERIEAVPGGWFILNHANYREKQTEQQAKTAERVRRFRERNKEAPVQVTPVTPGNGRKRRTASAYGDASASSEYREEDFDRFWDAYAKKRGKEKALKVWKRLAPSPELAGRIIQKANEYRVATGDKNFQKDPERWLAGKGWDDEIIPRSRASSNGIKGSVTRELWDGSTADPDYYKSEPDEARWGEGSN